MKKPPVASIEIQDPPRIAVARVALKARILQTRKAWAWKGKKPAQMLALCSLCGGILNDHTGAHMHEVLVTRGMAQGLPEEEYLKIFVEENSVLLHPSPCHIPMAQTDRVRLLLLKKLVDMYGMPRMCAFVDELKIPDSDKATCYHWLDETAAPRPAPIDLNNYIRG